MDHEKKQQMSPMSRPVYLAGVPSSAGWLVKSGAKGSRFNELRSIFYLKKDKGTDHKTYGGNRLAHPPKI